MQKSISSIDLLPNELRCLIACCQQEPIDDEIRLIKDNKSLFESTQFITLAQKHGVLPLVYQTFKERFSNLTADSLKKHYLVIARNNMFMSAELLRLSKLLYANGIEAIAFKGPVLSQEGYGDITLREFGDLDILVKKRDRFKAIQLLNEEDYIPEIHLKEKTKAYFYDAVNVLGLYHTKTNLHIEVHWELLSKTYAISWNEESLWNTKHSLTLNRQGIWTLSAENHLHYLCIHGAKHLFERLEWISDINRFIRSHPTINWGFLLEQATKQRTKRMLFFGLNIAKTIFRTELPPVIEERLIWDKKVQSLTSALLEVHFPQTFLEGKNISYLKILCAMREHPVDKLYVLWHSIVSPTIDDFQFVQLPGYLKVFYPFIRIYRLLKKYF